MFFPELIKNIRPNDRVLEIGPGSLPHSRSDVYLEKIFDEDEADLQRGHAMKVELDKPVIYYKELPLPLKDNEFDYIICSHVLEHVADVDVFTKELFRVAKKGYLEFPTIYYDYIYNFNVHITYLFLNNGTLYWMPKNESQLDSFKSVQRFFNKTLEREHYDFVNDFKEFFFQGIEWETGIPTQKVSDIDILCYSPDIQIEIPQKKETEPPVKDDSFLTKIIKRFIKKAISKLKSAPLRNDSEIEFENSFMEFKALEKSSLNRFQYTWEDRFPCLNDKTTNTEFDAHYIYHTAWAARVLKQINPALHIDISSALYFSTLISAFIPVTFYDFRPANIILSNLEMKSADLCNLHFENNSLESISCMHVVEHIGLGRYGDPLDYEGDLKAIKELKRVLKPGGDLLFVVPIGKPKIMFNAHRIYSYEQIITYFKELYLKEFSLIPDNGQEIGLVENAKQVLADKQYYACGCFWFKKNHI